MTDETKELPLGLKAGSVRAIIVLLLIVLAALFMYLDKSIPEWMVSLVVMAVTFYFTVRKDA